MAQSGYTPISLYYSTTASTAPTAGNLVNGELAINIIDGKLYYKDNSGVVQVIGTKGGVGSSTTTQVLYNSSGLVVGSANMTFNGTSLTLANDASISGLTVGKGGGSVATNTALGVSALASNSTGYQTTAVGFQALNANTGNNNTAFGTQALVLNTSGTDNTAVGLAALGSNTTGAYNTSVGELALNKNTTASNNTAVGYQAGYTNSTGAYLTAIGYQSLYSNTAADNTAIGYLASNANTTGTYNVAVGGTALQLNTTGSYNTAVGRQALYANTTASFNTAVGTVALGANTTGSYNAALGYGALNSNTTASNNTAVGYQAGYSANTPSNVFIGYVAGYAATTGGNTIVGAYAGQTPTGGNNTLVGFGSGNALTTGSQNTFVGSGVLGASYGAGSAVTTGTKNTILGAYSGNQGGLDIRTASNYIVLSDGDGNPRGIFDNNGNFLIGKTSTAAGTIGTQILATGQIISSVATATGDTLDVYNTTAGAYRFYVDTGGTIHATSTTITAISDQRLKENVRDLDVGLAEVMALQPRRFDWKEGKGLDKKDDIGFIAQEFETVFPNSVTTSKAGEDGIEYKAVSQSELIPTLVKAIQELKAEVDSLKQQLGA